MDAVLALPKSKFDEWQAFYILEQSDDDPEPTKWDTKETAAEKLRRKALRGTT